MKFNDVEFVAAVVVWLIAIAIAFYSWRLYRKELLS